MRLAVFADIHANRQAFSACLEAARARGAERIVCLGDIVGYGADPEWAVDTVIDLVERGAIAVRGNHDNAIGIPSENMNAVAQAAIEWTRGRLSGAAAAVPRRVAADAAGGRSPLRAFRGKSPRALALRAEHVGCRAQPRGDRRPCHLLRTHPPARAVFDVGGGEDDEFRPDVRCARAIAGRPALARRHRLRRTAARRQSGGGVCDVRHGDPRDHFLPRALRRRGGRGQDSRQRPAALAGRSPARRGDRRW